MLGKDITISNKSLNLRLKLFFALIFVILFILLFLVKAFLIVFLIFAIGFLRILVTKPDYKTPIVAFVIPWTLLYIFYTMDITDFSRSVSDLTLKLMSFPVLVSMIILPEFFTVKQINTSNVEIKDRLSVRFIFLFLILLILFVANVVYSGFLPLINIMTGGDESYMDYGIKGVNGLFNAYANSFAVLSYFFYITTRNKTFLIFIAFILAIFVLCLTRQNIISLLVEITILHSILVKSISTGRIILMFCIAILAFGFLGELRSGDIRELMRLKENFYWLPTGFIWVYSYGYFNILNLDNLVTSGEIGMFDGSSLATLLPSFLRPVSDPIPDNLEAVNFTVSSYINPILRDWGSLGVLIFTLMVILFSALYFKKAMETKTFLSVSIYCVLYYCALFSFFVNFWFYLPIIFQIPFFVLFNKLLVKRYE